MCCRVMSLSEKLWDTLATVIKMNDRVERVASSMKRIEGLSMRVVHLETALEIAMLRPTAKVSPRRLTKKD